MFEATSHMMMEVCGGTYQSCGGTSHVMTKVYDATSHNDDGGGWRSQSYNEGMWRY